MEKACIPLSPLSISGRCEGAAAELFCEDLLAVLWDLLSLSEHLLASKHV